MTAPAQPVENRSELVRQKLEQELFDGALIPGQILDERSLAQRFGVSRTPVREAILQLASQRLVKVIPRVGVVVTKLTIKELLALLEMLAELEGICAKFAASRMSKAERAALQATVIACEQAAEAGDSTAYSKANKGFHESIYHGAKNHWATEQIHALRLCCSAYQQSRLELPGRLAKSLAEHRKVLQCILTADEDGARLAMIEHISLSGKDLVNFISALNPALLSE
ncbi:GntR family transcriptional regulator [Pseudomonas sp. 5P_3.1_Bac2]|uniref:GntR family transcriptional regulator n=1 Tax=Pseudomonas sp. 5P_3.1_Bac2 TaxID=2971617 RepID=UPI0021CA2521|nr:GntR family transcriptional regulator [Pseudomonas sp. 5P_3.1_Bac2]MCU1716379.1 GntR family transcriptional regulator [Pseudomonas sp. 5P_3.1_Bac2]